MDTEAGQEVDGLPVIQQPSAERRHAANDMQCCWSRIVQWDWHSFRVVHIRIEEQHTSLVSNTESLSSLLVRTGNALYYLTPKSKYLQQSSLALALHLLPVLVMTRLDQGCVPFRLISTIHLPGKCLSTHRRV